MAVRRGDATKTHAERHHGYVRRLRVRLLAARVLQAADWNVADQLGCEDTLDADVALTQLQADALITLEHAFATGARDLIPIGLLEPLTSPRQKLPGMPHSPR